MKNTKALFSLFLLSLSLAAAAQGGGPWKGKGCAVVLTYDDALNVHLTKAIPALDSFGLRGTFYISDYFNGLGKQIPAWRRAAAKGHELGNHTIWHPCEGGRPGREFVRKDYDFQTYSVRRIQDEILGMNNLLFAIDGKRKRTFAFPCGDTKVNDTAYMEGLGSTFTASRGVHPEMLSPQQVNLAEVGAYTVNGQTGAQLISLVKEAMEKKALLVLLFHGVGGEHGLDVSLPAHRELLQFLKSQQRDIWVDTMVNVAEFIQKEQGR